MRRIVLSSVLSAFGALAAFAQLADGNFTAADAKLDAAGYTARIGVAVKGGRVSAVFYEETNPKSKIPGKSKDAGYNALMKKSTGVSWEEGLAKLEAELKAKNDPNAVDAVAGATALSARFKRLAAEALGVKVVPPAAKAAAPESKAPAAKATKTASAGPGAKKAAGEFEGVSDAGMGGTIRVKVKVDGGKLTEVRIVEAHETEGIGSRAVEELPGAVLKAQSFEVDGIAGATISSKAIREAVKDAMAKAGIL